MNLLETGFLFLNLFMLVFGFLINYVNHLFPKCVIQLFRYGRANVSSAKPGFVRSVEVPKRWFWHFYLYAVTLQLAVLITLVGIYFTSVSANPNQDLWLYQVLNYVGERELTASSTTTLIATTLFFLHLSRRLYETLWVSVYSNTKMNVFHYLLGFAHYTGAILCLVAHSPLLASSEQSNVSIKPRVEEIGLVEIIGIIQFLAGNYVQNRAHVGLANLRKGGKDKKEDSPSTRTHKIPRGGFFEFISCPNYFGEILIYFAVAGIFGFRNSSWNQCLYWVVCNQITSGIMNHLWYIETFKEYPKQRKAVIPFIL